MQLFNKFSIDIPILVIGLCELVFVVWMYGLDRYVCLSGGAAKLARRQCGEKNMRSALAPLRGPSTTGLFLPTFSFFSRYEILL